VRAKQSFNASGMQSSCGVLTPYLTNHARPSRLRARGHAASGAIMPRGLRALRDRRSQPYPAAMRGEGLLHDARNLMGTIGLYCDLLSMPGVLKPEHREYPEELRLLGARSKSLIDHLMQSLFALEDKVIVPVDSPRAERAETSSRGGAKNGGIGGEREDTVKPVSLRSVVERCSGLLSRVASGRTIEIEYGPAAAVAVRVRDEVVERILVNLVRNAAAAMGAQPSPSDRSALDTLENSPAAIRILVGPLVSSVGEHKPWPFQRVRLVVEDAGRGMDTQQLQRLLARTGARSRKGHGIGFGVVLDLVAASGGEIRVMSEPQIGTRVQIEWPIVAMAEAGNGTDDIPDSALESSASLGLQNPTESGGTKSRRLENLEMGMEVAH
jgi:signal transduction histidine kinase